MAEGNYAWTNYSNIVKKKLQNFLFIFYFDHNLILLILSSAPKLNKLIIN